MGIVDTVLAKIEARRQKEADAKRSEIISAGDAQRKLLFAYVTEGAEDAAMVEFYASSKNPRGDLQADLASCKASIEYHKLMQDASAAESASVAAGSRASELQPEIQQAERDLAVARRDFPGRPTLDDYRGLRAAERTLQDLKDEESVARETNKAERDRMRRLREQADGLGYRFDPESQLDSPQNFVLRSSVASDAPASAARLEKVARLARDADEAREQVEALDAEIQATEEKVRRLTTAYEKSRADEDSANFRALKTDLQGAEDSLRKLREERNRLDRFKTEMIQRQAALA